VSTLRNLFVKLKDIRDGKSIAMSEPEVTVTKMKAELEARRSGKAKVYESPSLTIRQEPARMTARGVVPPGVREGKLYSDALGSEKNLKFKLSVKSKENQSSKKSKGLLKSKINPTEIKLGIDTFKSLKNGKVLIERNSKEEIEALGNVINVKC